MLFTQDFNPPTWLIIANRIYLYLTSMSVWILGQPYYHCCLLLTGLTRLEDLAIVSASSYEPVGLKEFASVTQPFEFSTTQHYTKEQNQIHHDGKGPPTPYQRR